MGKKVINITLKKFALLDICQGQKTDVRFSSQEGLFWLHAYN